jgi:hypothetical protein
MIEQVWGEICRETVHDTAMIVGNRATGEKGQAGGVAGGGF